MLDDNSKKAKKFFVEEITKEEHEFINLNIENIRRTDQEAENIIKKEMENQEIETIEGMTLEKRILLVKLLKVKGISSRQIVKVTGIKKAKIIGI